MERETTVLGLPVHIVTMTEAVARIGRFWLKDYGCGWSPSTLRW